MWFMENWQEILVGFTMMVTGATGITAMLPSQNANKFLNSLLKVLNTLAGNIGKNKNADTLISMADFVERNGKE